MGINKIEYRPPEQQPQINQRHPDLERGRERFEEGLMFTLVTAATIALVLAASGFAVSYSSERKNYPINIGVPTRTPDLVDQPNLKFSPLHPRK